MPPDSKEMLSAPLSFFNKLEEVKVSFEFDPVPEMTAPAIISENGYEAVPVHFVLRPRTREPSNVSSKRGSCFELIKELVKNPQTGATINKESFKTILTRNVQWAVDLATARNEVETFQANEKELLISLDEGKSHFEIPTFDFAITRQDEILFLCTATASQERVFFQISNYPPILEEVLRVFMMPPRETPNFMAFSLPILPGIEAENLVIQSASVFENFVDESYSENESIKNLWDYGYNENNENMDPIIPQQQQQKSKPKRSESTAKPANTNHRKCLNCFCTSTPMWRRGPDGTASLCNACGVKFKAGKLQLSPETIEENMKIVKQYAADSMQQGV